MEATSWGSPGEIGGNQPDYGVLTMLEPTQTPFTSMVKKRSVSATKPENAGDKLRAPRITGTNEGKNAAETNNKGAQRQRFPASVQRFFDESGVTDTQEIITQKGGNAYVASEIDKAKAKTQVEQKRDIEAACLSNQEMDDGTTATRQMRGAFKWMSLTAQATNPVPEDFRPATASVLSGVGTSVPLFTEDELNIVLQSVKQTYGNKETYQVFAGDNVVRTVDGFTRVNSSSTNTRYQVHADEKTHGITLYVTFFDTSFGRCEMISDQFVRITADGGTGDANAALIAKMDMWELDMLEDMFTKDLEDKGGGPRFFARGQVGLGCLNPRGNGAIYNT